MTVNQHSVLFYVMVDQYSGLFYVMIDRYSGLFYHDGKSIQWVVLP